MILQRVHAFIKHDGLRHTGRDGGALVERLAGLFHPVARGNAVQHADGGCGLPGAVHIEGDVLAGGKGGGYGVHAGDVQRRIAAADLGRMGAVAVGAGGADQRDHLVRRAGRDRGIDGNRCGAAALVTAPAKTLPDRHARRLAEDVPCRDVDGRLHIGVPGKRDIHHRVQMVDAARVDAEKRRRQRFDSGAYARAVGGKIGVPPRAGFSPAAQPRVGVDPDEGAVQPVKPQPATGQEIGLAERKIHLPDGDPGDPHAFGLHDVGLHGVGLHDVRSPHRQRPARRWRSGRE